MEKQEVNEINERISNSVGKYTAAEVGIIKNSIAKTLSNSELAYFLNVCKTVDLNPFNKEIWAYKDNRGNLLIFAGRDGFLAKAQKNPRFAGMRSCEIRENDDWEINIPEGEINHRINKRLSERGAIIGAYAFVFRIQGRATIEYVDFDTYNKGFSTWKSHPSEMIKKVAEAHALKKAFGISGIQTEYDFNYENGVVIPIDAENPKNKYDHLTMKEDGNIDKE